MRSLLRLTILMAVLCAATFVLCGQTSDTVPVLHGVGAERSRLLLQAIRTPDGSIMPDVRTVVADWYRAQGFYRARLDSVAGEDVWITEGKPTYLQRLDLSGSGDFAGLRGEMEQREGDVFIDETLQRDMSRMLTALGGRGYLDARIVRGEMSETEDSESFQLALQLKIEAGPVFVIDDVRFIGLSVTTPATAARMSGLQSGERWLARAGDAAVRRLNRTRIFSQVSDPSLTLTKADGVRVGFDVHEGRPNSVDGVVGYLPPSIAGGTGTVTGLVDVRFGNLFGTARQLHARWYQERQLRHEIDVGYREPFIAGWPVSGEVGLFQRRQDSTYVRLDGSLALEAEVGLDMFAGLTLSSTTTTPIEGYGKTVIAQSSSILIGATFSYDTRDRPVATRSGALYATSLATGRKSWSFGGTTTASGIQRVSFDTEFYLSLFRYQTLVLSARWRQVTGTGVDQSDLYRIGGSTHLRGYGENEFSGSRLIWQTTEYRFFLSPNSFIGGFVDFASIHPGSGSPDLFRVGYGITSLIDTPVGLVGVSIALGKGDGIGDAKLHVRLRTEF